MNVPKRDERWYYNLLINEYYKGFLDVKRDKDLEDAGVFNNIFSVDFSELFVFMFRSPTSRIDFQSIEYIFNENLKRDFNFTLLPPAILEMRRHYDNLQRISKRYEFPIKVINSNELEDAVKLANKLKDVKDENSKEYKKLYNSIRKKIVKFHEFEKAVIIANDFGQNNKKSVIDESHIKLIKLFEKNIIVPPQEIDSLHEIVTSISSNQIDFIFYLDKLNKKRPALHKELNNLIDAEHAALILDINKKIIENYTLNIFTGSHIPLEIYQKNLFLNQRSLVRCPVYILIRTFCKNNLEFIDENDFINSSIDVLKTLRNGGSIDTSLGELQQKLSSATSDKDVVEIQNKCRNIVLFQKIFFIDQNLSRGLNDAFKAEIIFPEIEDAKLRFYQDIDASNSVDQLSKINLMLESLSNLEQYEDNLSRAREKIFKNTKEIFKKYYKFLRDYNYSLLSPIMKKQYDHIMLEPEEEGL